MPPGTAAVATTVSEVLVISPLVVSAFPAQRRFASALSVAYAMVGPAATASARSTSSAAPAHDWPPSDAVFKMLTPRNSADGQPWETGATWPG